MVKHRGKDAAASFRNLYGDTLILNMKKSNGCLEVSIINRSPVFSQKSTSLISCICATALLSVALDINNSCFIIIGLFMFITLYKSFFSVKEEKVLIIKGFGCHISKKHFFGKSTVFIPYEKIEKVFINEVIFRHRVIYLLILLTKGWTIKEENKLVPLFMNLLPRIDCLQIIYKSIQFLDNR